MALSPIIKRNLFGILVSIAFLPLSDAHARTETVLYPMNEEGAHIVQIAPFDTQGGMRELLEVRIDVGVTYRFPIAVTNEEQDLRVTSSLDASTVISSSPEAPPIACQGESTREFLPFEQADMVAECSASGSQLLTGPDLQPLLSGEHAPLLFQTEVNTHITADGVGGVGIVSHAVIISGDVAVTYIYRTNCADANGDRTINGVDLSVLLSEYGQSGLHLMTDFNADSIVNGADLSQLLSQFNSQCMK